MFINTKGLRVFVYQELIDMRCGFEKQKELEEQNSFSLLESLTILKKKFFSDSSEKMTEAVPPSTE